MSSEKPTKATGGKYHLVTLQQWSRFYNIGRMARADKKRFAPVMAPDDPQCPPDTDGDVYFGSISHTVETALRLLEEKLCRS